jgi:chromate reductase
LPSGNVELQGDPAPVAAFTSAIREADALLIGTPEYNHGVPAVPENAIVWASRSPHGAPLGSRLAAIIGASPGVVGSARAETQLRQAFTVTNTYAMLQPEILVRRAHERFDEQGRLTDETTRTFLATFLGAVCGRFLGAVCGRQVFHRPADRWPGFGQPRQGRSSSSERLAIQRQGNILVLR